MPCSFCWWFIQNAIEYVRCVDLVSDLDTNGSWRFFLEVLAHVWPIFSCVVRAAVKIPFQKAYHLLFCCSSFIL